jgi:hypothetical protein
VLTRFTAETATCTSVKSDYKSIMHIASQTKFETWWGWLTGWLASGSAWQLSGRSLTGARRESGGSLRCPLRSGLSQPAAHGSSTSGNSIGNLKITAGAGGSHRAPPGLRSDAGHSRPRISQTPAPASLFFVFTCGGVILFKRKVRESRYFSSLSCPHPALLSSSPPRSPSHPHPPLPPVTPTTIQGPPSFS